MYMHVKHTEITEDEIESDKQLNLKFTSCST